MEVCTPERFRLNFSELSPRGLSRSEGFLEPAIEADGCKANETRGQHSKVLGMGDTAA